VNVPLSHHSLVAWQRADDLFIRLHQLSLQAFPSHERYELGTQLRRAAYSVAANIVEGFARRHRRDRLHFLNIAESSLAEFGYCIHVALRLGYIAESIATDLEHDVKAVGAPLVGLVRSTRVAMASQAGAVLLGVGRAFFWLAR
jgi:four helix bundle protein